MFLRVALLLGLTLVVSAGQTRINCGGPQIPSIGWRKDTGKYRSKPSGAFSSGRGVSAPGSWKPVYKTHAYAPTGNLVYRLPVNPGTYTVYLLFAEMWVKKPNVRVFFVSVNGAVVKPALDVFKSAGGIYRALFVPVTGVNAASGYITVKIGRIKQNPMISGIVIEGKNTAAKIGNEGIAASSKPACGSGGSKNVFALNIGGPKLGSLGFGPDKANFIVGNKGKVAKSNAAITVEDKKTAPVFRTQRFTRAAALTYKFKVPGGKYTVTVMHAEAFFTVPNSRVFNIVINDRVVAGKVDVFSVVGKNREYVRKFHGISPVRGAITVSFRRIKENPFVNGIVITSGGSCRAPPQPKRSPRPSTSPEAKPTPPFRCGASSGRSTNVFMMNCGGPSIKVTGYGADNVKYIVGNRGATSKNDVEVMVSEGSNLAYLNERYTKAAALIYKIPMPSGVFTVTTIHSESYFNARKKRIFSIFINGGIKRRDLDVFAAAGGKNKALVLTFKKISSVGGFIKIKFQKVAENPFVNGIKIEGPGADRKAIGGCD